MKSNEMVSITIELDKKDKENMEQICAELENSWTDSDMMDALESMGVTRKDLIACGFGEFVQNYESQQ